jgi:hypothetical protein
MNIWEFSELLSRRLLSWNILNILIGLTLWLRSPFWRGVGSQSIGWGLINSAIAIVGGAVTHQRFKNLPDPLSANVTSREARNLRRILWVNTFLDVLYILGGARFSQTQDKTDKLRQGIGAGIVIQGALLFVFDLVHARSVPNER